MTTRDEARMERDGASIVTWADEMHSPLLEQIDRAGGRLPGTRAS